MVGEDLFKLGERLSYKTGVYLVNPVNAVGVMGAGLAKQFASRYPSMLGPYKGACKSGLLDIGKPWIWNNVICLATKKHWRDPSQYSYVEASLKSLMGMSRTMVLPPLGAGLGGLDVELIEDMIDYYLDPSPVTHYLTLPPTRLELN